MGAVLDVPLLGRMRLLRRLGELRRRLSARRRDELRKERSRSLQQQRGVVELDHAPRIHDGDPVVVDDRVQPVRDREQRAFRAGGAQHRRRADVGLGVDGRGRLVEQHESRAAQQRTRKAQQLALAHLPRARARRGGAAKG